MLKCWVLVAAILILPFDALSRQRTLSLEFTPQTPQFATAAEEYRQIWAAEGPRIIAAMEKATNLQFPRAPVRVVVYEGTSFSGDERRPMQLRASYPSNTKKATLVHELGHRLVGRLALPPNFDEHPTIFLFVYDVWTTIWGKEFADSEVIVESGRRGLYDYEGAWKAALGMTASERAAKFAEFLASHQPERR